MKKSLLLFAIFALVSVLLCSCKVFVKDNGKDNQDNSQNSTTDSGFFGEGKQFYFVEGEGVALQNKIDEIFNHVTYSTYVYPKFITSAEIGGENEIVFGKCDREISKDAYSRLDRYYTGVENESGWLIYVKGNSLCVAFDTNQAMRKAIEYLEDNLLELDFDSNKGVVAYETFDRFEVAYEERTEKQAEAFEKLESKIGADGVQALENLYSLYDENIYIWMANLYCPDVGGFYYSNSGRNTEGFLPDIESTKQVLGFISSSGMLEDNQNMNYGTAILQYYPELAEQMLNFAINLQAEDGYFYHPQWGTSITTSRLGRDLSNAKRVITAFGGKPKYPYPDEKTSSNVGAVSDFKLTNRLSTTCVSAVSKVVATAAPEYLQDLGKWAAYINSLKIDKGYSYPAGNTLASMSSMIKAAGQEYVNYLINYLNTTQCDNGTWDPVITDSSINGLMKISAVYENLGAPLPRAKEAVQSCITRTIDTTPSANGDAIVDCYNPWYATAAVLRMVSKHETNYTKKNEIRQMINDNFADMVNSTLEKVAIFKRLDGSFSYYQETTSYTSQGAAVAVPGAIEGDVNATAISIELVKWIFECIGEKTVPIFCFADFELFMETIYDLGSIIKDPAPDPVSITFDDFDISVDQTENGVVTNPDEMVEIVARDKDAENREYVWFDSEVANSPISRVEEDKALKFEVKSKTCRCTNTPCTCKTVADNSSIIYTRMQNNAILGNTYVAEFDFYLDSWGINYIVTQLEFVEVAAGGPSMSLNLETYVGADGNNYLKLWDNLPGLDGMKNSALADGIPVKEWVRFRFELYITDQLLQDENSGEVKQIKANVCKIYVNGEYVAESDAARVKADGTTDTKNVNGFSIFGCRHTPSVFYVDNLLVYKTDTNYICEEEAGNGVLDNMAIDKSQTVATFNDGKTATYYLKNLAVPGYIRYSVKDVAGKTALCVEKYATPAATQMYTQAKLSNLEQAGECYTYEAKIYYDSANMTYGDYVTQLSVNASSSLSFIGFNLKFYGTYVEMQHDKNYLNGASTGYSGKVKGVDGKDVYLPVDEWFIFKMEFYKGASLSDTMVKIYTGDENGNNMTLRAEMCAAKTNRTDAIERFLFTHYRAADYISVYLDDVSFTRSDKVFVSSLPDEHVDGFLNPYESGDVRISDNTANEDYNGTDKVSAATDPKNSENNVLKIESKKGSATPYNVKINRSGSQITNGLSAFETKIFLESVSNGHFATLVFSRTDGSIQEIRIIGGASHAYFDIPEGYTVTSNAIAVSNAQNRISVGKWHTIRLEFTNADEGEYAFLELFIDGTSIGKFIGYKATSNVQHFEISGTSSNSEFYLDDVSFREYHIEKTPTGGEGADEFETLTEGESFDKLGGNLTGDGTDSTVKFGKNDGYFLTETQPDDTVIVTRDPTGAENNVLMFRDGMTTSHGTVWVGISGKNYVSNSEKQVVSVFETKLYIEKPKANSDIYLAQLFFTSGQTSRTSMNVVGVKQNGEFAYAYFSLIGSSNSKSRIEFDKWYTLRIEYHNVIEGATVTPYMEIFINGESVGENEATKSNGSYDFSDVNGFFWKSFSTGLSTVYFDNMSYTEKQMDYPSAPVTPPSEGDDEGENENPSTSVKGATFDNVTTLKGDGTDRVGIKFSYGIGNVETAGEINAGDEISIVQDPANENNKVLMFKDDSSSGCSTLFIQASSDYHGVARNGLSVFETKIYIPKSEILTTGVISQPQFNQGGRSLAHAMNLNVDSDKTHLYFDLSNTEGSETSGNISVDTWHVLRLEFCNYSSTDLRKPIIKVYIDNLYAGYIESTNVKDISGFMWKGLSSAKCTIYFDNMSFSEKALPTE